jgi:hypothetical protein
MTLRARLADILIRWAYCLDPHRANAVAMSDGTVQIRFAGVPLANVTPGQIRDLRGLS